MLLSDSLQETIQRELPLLRALTDVEAGRSLRGGWTRKQELGHLLDSATNNHARFVRIALEDQYRGSSYDPDAWVELHGYAGEPWNQLVDFWFSYNSMLAVLIARIPEHRLATMCEIGKSGPISLGFLIGDYVVHMQHHIDQMLGRERITPYPQASAAAHR